MMAKPKHGRPFSLHDRPPSRSHATHFPSPAVLSALAVIATTPVLAGPLSPPTPPPPPPTFLCPFIERDNILSPRADTPSTSASTTPTSQCGAVADKYVQESDSLWRKTGAWTLYGSTCPSGSTANTPAAQSQPNSSQSSVPASTLDTVEFDTAVLPAGWDNLTTTSPNTESTTILALAIVLAGSICVFMIGCVIWRRRKKRTRDIERKLKEGPHDDSQVNGRGKDARGKMRIWAKATARWKSNIRQSARRRRKRPTVNRPLSPTFADSSQLSAVAPSTPRRGSIASEESDPSRPEAASCLNGNATEPPAVLHDPPRSTSPPTYRASFVPRFSCLPPSSAVSNPSSPDPAQRGNLPSFTEDEPLPYIPPSDGHVATDDKSQLAHIRELASSPPTVVDATGASTMQSVSAPELDEVENDLEDIDLSEVPTSFHNFGLPPSFPPPPSKADLPLPFGYLDDHPLRYGEDGTPVPLPVPGSLAPSLEASPSAPPIDDPGLEPSAPSLEGEDELFQDWDWASSYVHEVPTSADLDSVPACAIESSISSTISSTSHASFPSIRESATRGGTLPRYHP